MGGWEGEGSRRVSKILTHFVTSGTTGLSQVIDPTHLKLIGMGQVGVGGGGEGRVGKGIEDSNRRRRIGPENKKMCNNN